ncbi:hypothetical protein OIDMADRAFT_172890 [Oidiodendron maius Zn]|uniref:Nudix hydrolase domain-containing protein n=1 Tax=Oidiodendron maius (strain Zn) TaxID=913774 RepID=A0A0C3GDD8_OIDMZ|nr:hypothetical protein OIDMADRAFT_172890 [Oidiodendron maius Zn]
MDTNLRQRAIVSSFICTSPQAPEGLTFALFKRSEKVNSYPSRWAVCSGSISCSNSSPESAAQREILEETTLSIPEDIYLLRYSKPFLFIDHKLRTE